MQYPVCIALALVPIAAAADPPEYDLALRSQVGWGATVGPDRVALTSEGGWNGGDRRGVVSATVEATVVPRLSVFANAVYGGDMDHGRPAAGAAYQLIDPRDGDQGIRLSLAYKPEGFTEPDGEFESVLVASRRISGGLLRGMLAYGQDADRKESDGELGVSLVERVSRGIVVGGTFRYRRGFVVKPGEPGWDVIGGVLGGVAVGHARVELLVGADGIRYATTQWGIVGLLGFGADL